MRSTNRPSPCHPAGGFPGTPRPARPLSKGLRGQHSIRDTDQHPPDRRRSIPDVTCKVMSMADGTVIAVPDMRGESFVTTGTFAGAVQPRTLEIAPDEQPGERYLNLLPGKHCRFTFDGLHADPDHIVVAWFTDDAGFRWQLDEHRHLAETKGDAYVA
jgi:hypothetical protein